MPAPEEQLIDLSQALSLGRPRHDARQRRRDETILEEDNRAPSPTKRDRVASEDFWDADYVPREWVAPPKTPKTREARARCIAVASAGSRRRGHVRLARLRGAGG